MKQIELVKELTEKYISDLLKIKGMDKYYIALRITEQDYFNIEKMQITKNGFFPTKTPKGVDYIYNATPIVISK